MNIAVPEGLAVWWGDRMAGTLVVDRHGAMHFAYAQEWLADLIAPALSHAMPKRQEPYSNPICTAVFGGLLPEEAQRTAIAGVLGVSPDNPFRLLKALGGDVAGALAFLPIDERPPNSIAQNPGALSETGLAELIDRLPHMPMLAGEGGARLCLAGEQSKLPVVLIDNQVAIPQPGQPSTHLIKPEPAMFPGLAANEAFCLALARAVGLDVVAGEWRSAKGRPFLLVTRYDRLLREEQVQSLHQEDFAQALGVPSNRKYAVEGGPVFRNCFDLLRGATTRPAVEVLKLVDAAIFNVIIGNADAHAKNFSLLRRGESGQQVVMAPLYDLVATVMWKELSPRLSMTFGGARTLEHLAPESFDRFARSARVSAPFVRRRSRELAERVINTLKQGLIVPGLYDDRLVGELAATIEDRANRFAIKAGQPVRVKLR